VNSFSLDPTCAQTRHHIHDLEEAFGRTNLFIEG